MPRSLIRPVVRPISRPIVVQRKIGGSAFSPLDISSCRLLLDASDISTLFQNAAGTTPVTATGQNVLAWRSLTSHATLFTQSSSSNAPSYLVADGLPSVLWNASAFRWLDATVDLSGTNSITIVAALRILSTASNRVLMTQNNENNPSFMTSFTSAPAARAASRGDGTARNITTSIPSGDSSQVITSHHRISSALCRIQTGNNTPAETTLSQGAGNFANALVRIGARVTVNDLTLHARLHALALFTAIIEGDDLAKVKAWMSLKAGVAL